MTDGPLRCLKFLLAIHADKEPQSPGLVRICRAVQGSERSVKRWLSHLATVGAIVMRRGGDSKMAKISVFISIEAFLARPKKVACPNPIFGLSEGKSGPSEPEKWPVRPDINLKVEEREERKSVPVENIEPKTPELSEEDRLQLKALRETYPHASRANLLEALAEYKASGVKYTDVRVAARPVQSSVTRRSGTSSDGSTASLGASISDLAKRKKLG